MIGQANAVRGEVTLDLAGISFVLRPSYEAVEACEQQTGLALTQLALAADDGSLKLGPAAIVVTELVRAWGRETGTKSAVAVQPKKIAQLLFDMGVMVALPRLAIVLLSAASGGVDASGKAKPMPEMTILPGIGDVSQGSPAPPSAGRRRSSGRRPATSSSARSPRGGK